MRLPVQKLILKVEVIGPSLLQLQVSLLKLKLKLLCLASQNLKLDMLPLPVVVHLSMIALEFCCQVCELLLCPLALLYALVIVVSELISAPLCLLYLSSRVIVVFLKVLSPLMGVLEVKLGFSESSFSFFESCLTRAVVV